MCSPSNAFVCKLHSLFSGVFQTQISIEPCVQNKNWKEEWRFFLNSRLQSYGIHYRDENDVEVITYVDYVDPLGQAHRAGLRSGKHSNKHKELNQKIVKAHLKFLNHRPTKPSPFQ